MLNCKEWTGTHSNWLNATAIRTATNGNPICFATSSWNRLNVSMLIEILFAHIDQHFPNVSDLVQDNLSHDSTEKSWGAN